MQRLPIVTKNILIINILMWILTELRPDLMFGLFSLYFPTSPHFHFWQPVTHMFMHANFTHLFLNMFSFLMFGCSLERQWGPRKYTLFYFVTGLGAAALQLGVMALSGSHAPMVGASGAVFGILMGYAMLYPDTRLTLIFPPISLKAKWWVVIWIVMEIVNGLLFSGAGVAHFAHLGGMLFGYLLIKYWKQQGKMYEYED